MFFLQTRNQKRQPAIQQGKNLVMSIHETLKTNSIPAWADQLNEQNLTESFFRNCRPLSGLVNYGIELAHIFQSLAK